MCLFFLNSASWGAIPSACFVRCMCAPKYIIIIYILGPRRVYISMTIVYNRVIKNRVRAPTHHTGNKSPDTRRGSFASLAIHNPCRSQFIAFKRLCIHCTQVNILRLQVTLKPLSPSLHLATCVVKVACMCSYALKQRWCTQICK